MEHRWKVFVSPDCQQIKIVPAKDYHSHYMILQLDDSLNVTILAHSLPENDKYFKPVGTIGSYSDAFFNLLQQTEEFYAQMNSIDELTYVVDPEEITTKHNYRVIKLGKNFCLRIFAIHVFLIQSIQNVVSIEDRVYMKIKVDPLDASSVTTTFYGPSKKIEQYRQNYHEKLDDWSVNDDIYRNFLRIFSE